MKKLVKFAIFLVWPSVLMGVSGNYYSIGINDSDSLPSRAYLIRKGVLPQTKGEYVAFVKKGNRRVGDTGFIKIIGGKSGDTVTEVERRYYIDGHYIGTAKTHSLQNEPVEKAPAGLIPQGYYFVYGLHKDSYDSKYKEIGLVAESEVIGTAIPVL